MTIQVLQHKDLLAMPRRIGEPLQIVTAIVLPCSGEVGDNATMTLGYARQAREKWPQIAKSLGYCTLKWGVRPHALTFEDRQGAVHIHGAASVTLPWHVLSFPTRRFDQTPIDRDLVIQSARNLRRLLDDDGPQPLREGLVVFPVLHDGEKMPWEKLEPWLEMHFTDCPRLVFIEGNRGTPT